MKTVGLQRLHCSGSFEGRTRTLVAAVLCSLLTMPPLLAEGDVGVANTASSPSRTLQGDRRILHALNRLSFGPHPNDLNKVRVQGLDRWFESQLNPAAIDDSSLDQRLAAYPATQMSVAELERRYPSPATLRAVMAGKVPMPAEPARRALLADQLESYNMREAKNKLESRSAEAVTPERIAMLSSASASAAASAVPGGMPGTAATNAEAVYSAQQVTELLGQAPDVRMRTLLALAPADLVRLRERLRPAERLQLLDGLKPLDRETLMALSGSSRMIGSETMQTRLLRDLYSNRQLEAVMTDFWLNHFNVFIGKNQNEPYLIPIFERETIRPHALGRFEDLLVATAQSPAMLVYLDNARSTGPGSPAATRIRTLGARQPGRPLEKVLNAGLNENYGRELMELHTLGVAGGYTQADVTEVAKVFTGWTLERPDQGGDFRFDQRRHEPGVKVVLGHRIQPGGEAEGLEVLHLLANSPATARFLSQKIAVRFVSDTPPTALVDAMTRSFLASGGDIKVVLRTMFHAPEFWSTDVEHAKVKTPLEFLVSAVRASDLDVTDPLSLVASLDKLGMPLYGMQTPNGYSWTQEQWVSTGALVSRMNFALVISGDRLPGLHTRWPVLLRDPHQTPLASPISAQNPPNLATAASTTERQLEVLLLGQPASDRTHATVLAQANDTGVTEQALAQFDLRKAARTRLEERRAPQGDQALAPTLTGPVLDPRVAVMAGLLLGSPEFQRR